MEPNSLVLVQSDKQLATGATLGELNGLKSAILKFNKL